MTEDEIVAELAAQTWSGSGETILDMGEQEVAEAKVLIRGAVTLEDFLDAIDAWPNARVIRGGTTWGFVRTVALRKKAERIVAVEREA